jgi:XTP/dITP diphosphohydrolase
MEGSRRLLVATRSRHKLEELRALLRLEHAVLVDLDDVGITDEAVEDAGTFRGNAAIKARIYGALSGMPTLADDSGLEVDALGGGPGVRTRRYAGETATDAENNAKLLRELRGVPPDRRGARYRCALAFLDAPASAAAASAAPAPASAAPAATASASGRTRTPRLVIRTGTFEGRIADGLRGTGGFGYDPLFEPAAEPVGGRTVGQMTAEEKNRVSHRARAGRAMARYLREQGW